MKYRILFVHGNSNIIGGQELSLLYRIKGLRSEGVSSVVALPRNGSFSRLLEENEISVRFVSLNRIRKSNPLPYLSCCLSIYKLIRKEQIKIVHTSGVYPNQYCLLAARLAKVPCVVNINNTVYSKGDLINSLVKFADRIITISNAVKSDVMVKIKLDAKKIEVIYNPVVSENMSVNYSEKDVKSIRMSLGIRGAMNVVAHIGQIIPRKNLECFVEIAEKVKKELSDVKFLIIGEAPEDYFDYKDKITRLIREKSLTNDVILTGFKKNIESIIPAADILVNCSFAEGGPRVVIEAMALGKPVLSTRVGYAPEVIQSGVNGFLFTFNNSELMARSAIGLLQDKNKREQIGIKARNSICDKFSVKQHAKATKKLYERLLNNDMNKTRISSVLFYDTSSGCAGSANALACIVNNLNREKFLPILAIKNFGSKIKQIRNAEIFKFRDYGEPQTITKAGYLIFSIKNLLPEALKLYFIIKIRRVSLVHINTNIMLGLSAIIASRMAGIPCICHLRQTRGLLKREKFFINWVNRIIVLNKYAFNGINRVVSKKKLDIIFDGIELGDLHISKVGGFRDELSLDSSPLIGVVGRIIEGKGQKEFILAAKYVLETKPVARFVIVGDAREEDSSYYSNIKELVSKEGLENSIIFAGWRSDIQNIISSLDILVLPSTTFPEGLPNAIIEAMAFKKPVIASNIPGPSEIVVDGVTGLLFPPGDINLMAEKIRYLLENKEIAVKMGEEGRKRAETLFDIKHRIKDIEKIYEEVLNAE